MIYRADKWHWTVAGDNSRAWSSEARAYVTEWPSDRVTRIVSEAELRDVLDKAGCPDRAPGYVAPSIRIPKLTVIERLAAASKFDAARTALMADPLTYERWQASVTVDPTNAEVLALLAAIGADPTVILAPAD